MEFDKERKERKKISKKERHALEKIKKTKSQTYPVVLYWLVLFLIAIVTEYFFPMQDDLLHIVYIAGGGTFAYMTGGYASDIFINRQLPTGLGKIENMGQYKVLIWMWNMVALIAFVLRHVFSMEFIPAEQITLVAGSISVTFISGNKVNKAVSEA